ncbi:unnamed protein product [Lymnaea stagnalis]|uniref:Uncharacterized protein n=1 Tax=Lymnaea stagnalis TaxID=6523 RepID=A0AAV2IHK4_LYMST
MATVNMTINYRDGTSRTISQPVSEDKSGFNYNHLKKSVLSVHDQSNVILTNIVEEEKNQLPQRNIPTSTITTTVSTDDNADGDESEEDEEDNDDKLLPPEKKMKA